MEPSAAIGYAALITTRRSKMEHFDMYLPNYLFPKVNILNFAAEFKMH